MALYCKDRLYAITNVPISKFFCLSRVPMSMRRVAVKLKLPSVSR